MQVKIIEVGSVMDEDHENDLKELNEFLLEHKKKIQEVIGTVSADEKENIINVFHIFYDEEKDKKNTLSN